MIFKLYWYLPSHITLTFQIFHFVQSILHVLFDYEIFSSCNYSLKIIYGSLNIIDYAWVCLQKNHIMKKIDVYLNMIKLDEYVH